MTLKDKQKLFRSYTYALIVLPIPVLIFVGTIMPFSYFFTRTWEGWVFIVAVIAFEALLTRALNRIPLLTEKDMPEEKELSIWKIIAEENNAFHKFYFRLLFYPKNAFETSLKKNYT